MGGLDQQRIAHRVSQAVVDGLEAVEVQVQHRPPPLLPMRPLDGLFETGLRQQAVGQIGQRIVMGQIGELLLAVLDVADVGEHAGVMSGLPRFIEDPAQAHPLRIDLAVAAAIPDLAAPMPGLLQALPHLLEEGARVSSRLQETRIPAQDLRLGIAGDRGEGRIDRHDLGG